ncbi:MAG TPA: hypothetical protein ENI85_01100 [Deltaproteobacteria bacterium]|nr:hypothetical protein [Deltaproteobacteria bacterium]
MSACGRFAPSTTGRAHPGTLLAALLCWLDARSSGARVLLRLEDLDRERTKPGHVEAMERDLDWFGLDWDGRSRQSENRERHEEILERLVREGRVYACDCSRTRIRMAGRRAPDGGFAYPGTCRSQVVSPDRWRGCERPLRLRIESREIEWSDENGSTLSGDPVRLFGDPILRRRDGAIAYHLATVLDDAAAGVDRVVRGRDLMPVTILQIALQQDLGLARPAYRHHCLFLEKAEAGSDADGQTKLSKLHGAVDVAALRERYEAEALCGALASFVGLVPAGTVCRPRDLIADFDWSRVSKEDVVLAWDARDGLRRERACEGEAGAGGAGIRRG